MSIAREPLPSAAPRPEPTAPRVEERDRSIELGVRSSPTRCPYCHDECTSAQPDLVCAECLARHHTACWEAHGRCATCSSGRRLTPEVASPETKKKSSVLGTAMKLGLAALVFVFLVWRGTIDLSKVGAALRNPLWVGQAFALVFACLSIITLRWWLLLRLEKIELSLADALKLTLVGHFWNNVLPGAVTGDVVKMYYIGRRYPALKAEAYATVMIDRVVGLAALVFLSFFSGLANLDFIEAKGHEALRWTFLGNALAAAAFAVGILLLCLGVGRRSSIADTLREKLPFRETFRRGYRSLIRLGERPGTLAASFLLGVLSHVLLALIGMTAGHALGESSLSIQTYYFLVPVGLFVNSLPIGFPGGIGGGEAAFDQLFRWGGGFDASGACVGANVMLLLRIAQLSWGAVGALVYVFDRKALVAAEDATP